MIAPTLDTPSLAQSRTPPDVAHDAPPAAMSVGQRLVSLDAFRGLTIAAMLLVNNPGAWSSVYHPLTHEEWHGWTMTDLIFPFFLFIIGVAVPFSFAKRGASATSRASLLGHVWIRALSLFMLGALLHGLSSSGVTLWIGSKPPDVGWFNLGVLPEGFTFLKIYRAFGFAFCWIGIFLLLFPFRNKRLAIFVPIGITVIFFALLVGMWFVNQHAFRNGLPADAILGGGMFKPENYRIPGVLQRIGICYGIAGTIVLFSGWRLILTWLVALLAIYSVLMLAMPSSMHTTGSLEKEDNLARAIDVKVFNTYGKHAYGAYPDPEGLLSTIPAVGTILLGVLVGLSLRRPLPAAERGVSLLAMGVVVTIVGVLLSWWLMPINKMIWTPSFVVFTGGLGMLCLGTMLWAIDVRGRRRWALPMTIFGMNAIAAFVAAGLVVRIISIVMMPYRAGDKPQPFVSFAKEQINAAVANAGESLHWAALGSPYNQSLAWAIVFVFAIFLLMALLYVCRIFIKV